MASIKSVEHVKLFTGMISSEPSLFEQAVDALEKKFGKVNFESPVLPFNWTDFYNQEMGEGLRRKFVAFEKLVDPLFLSEAKVISNALEIDFSHRTADAIQRKINIDPGFVALSKMCLASVKDRPHRIYIGNGIYCEITLYFKKKSFHPWEWSYPDYASDDYIKFFNSLREFYSKELTDFKKGI